MRKKCPSTYQHYFVYVHYLHTVVLLLQRCAVLRQAQLAQPSGDRLMLHGVMNIHQHSLFLSLDAA